MILKDFKRKIIKEIWLSFSSAKLIPSEEDYNIKREKVTMEGTMMLNKIQSYTSQSLIEKTIDCMHGQNPRQDIIRILGFGFVLSKYFLEPLKLEEEVKKITAELGSISNLLVSLFDHFADYGFQPARLLSRTELKKIMLKDKQGRYNELSSEGDPGILIKNLTVTYFRMLHRLKLNNSTSYISDFINQLILEMYDSEIVTISKKKGASRSIIKRKSEIPFLVMGIPGWLAVKHFNKLLFDQHVKWLCKIGEFFGILDDIVDLEEDNNNNNPNRFLRIDNISEYNLNTTLNIAINNIIILFKEIVNEYEESGNCNANTFQVPINFFTICFISWLGGFRKYQYEIFPNVTTKISID